MGTRATSTFTIDNWQQETYDDAEGAQLARASLAKTFTGDLSGTSTAELLIATGQVESSKAYVAFERIVGRIGDRSGSFVLHHTAGAWGDQQSASWSIVPDTGTGGLHGIRGNAEIIVAPDGGHTLVLDYELP